MWQKFVRNFPAAATARTAARIVQLWQRHVRVLIHQQLRTQPCRENALRHVVTRKHGQALNATRAIRNRATRVRQKHVRTTRTGMYM